MTHEFNSVPIEGGPNIKLRQVQTPGAGDPRSLLATNSFVIYSADNPAVSNVELFAVPIEGGTPIQLGGNFQDGVDTIKVTPDGETVLFRVRAYSDIGRELLAVDLDPDPDGDGFLSLYDTCPLRPGSTATRRRRRRPRRFL